MVKRRRIERERREKRRTAEIERRTEHEKTEAEAARRLKRVQIFVMLGSISGCILLAGIYNLCFGQRISYRGHLGWTGDVHDAALGLALIIGPCIGELICWLIRRRHSEKR